MSKKETYKEKIKRRLASRGQTENGDECWNYTGTRTGNGYGHMSYEGRSEYTHRISAIVYLNFDPKCGLLVMHECDNPACWNPTHLSVGTQKQNMGEAAARGRMVGKKLNARLAGEIKYLLSHGDTYAQLSLRYGVSTTAIGQIARKQTWREVLPVRPTVVGELTPATRQEHAGDPPAEKPKAL